MDHEWENLEKSKQTFKEQVDKFIHDRDRLEKDLLEFRTCKEASDKAAKETMDEFKRTQAKIVQELEHREYQLERKEKHVRTFESDLHRREKQLTELILKNDRFDRVLSTKYFSPEDTDILTNLLPTHNQIS